MTVSDSISHDILLQVSSIIQLDDALHEQVL